MSFWPFGNNFDSSSINKLLEDPQLQLVDLLDSLDLLNELNNRQNQKLVEFLGRPEVLNQLVGFIVDSVDFYHNLQVAASIETENEIHANPDKDGLKKEEKQVTHINNETDNSFSNTENRLSYSNTPEDTANGDGEDIEMAENECEDDNEDGSEHDNDNEIETSEEESPEDIFRRRSHTAAEILSSDIWLISDTIVEQTPLLERIWSVLSRQLSESLPTVTFVVKIVEQLLDARPIEMLNFIRQQSHLVEIFLNNIEIAIIMDLLIRIISTDKPDNPTGIIEILSDQELIPRLINLLKPNQTPNIQSSSGDFLKALIAISANTALSANLDQNVGPNELTRELVSTESVKKMIDIMLAKGPGLATTVGIIIEVIRKNNSDYDPINLLDTTIESNPPNNRDPVFLGGMLKLFAENLYKFDKILDQDTFEINPLKSSVGLIEPLGSERFRISELIAELLHCSNMLLLNTLEGEEIAKQRDSYREKQKDRILAALSDSVLPQSGDEDEDVDRITNGLEDVSLDDTNPEKYESASNHRHMRSSDSSDVSNMTSQNEEEPEISPECPFVSAERDQSIRSNPVIGDFFKIKLIDSEVLKHIVNMFLRFPWNNFFHNVVFDLVQQIFNGKLNSYNSFLIVELFEKRRIDLTGVIIEGYEECVESEKNRNLRLGYMGHLILIAEEVVKFTTLYKPDLISSVIVQRINRPEWESYVNEILIKTREMYNTVLGGVSPDDSYIYSNPDTIVLGDSQHTQPQNLDDIGTIKEENERENDDDISPMIKENEEESGTSSSSSSDSDNDSNDNAFNSNDNSNVLNEDFNNGNDIDGDNSDNEDNDDNEEGIEEIGEILCRVPKHDDIELATTNKVH